MIDTAYTGFLLLPQATATELDLSPAGTSVLLLVDGTAKTVPVYSAWVNWLSQHRLMLVDVTDGPDALLGAHLLFPHRLRIDYTARTVEIT